MRNYGGRRMKKYRFIVEVEIPDCDDWNEVADNLREIIQDRFDFESDDEGRWKVSVKETTEERE